MNKKDCENIGYILSEANAPQHVCQKFFGLDERIESEYEGYREVINREEAVEKRFEELMTEALGNAWPIKKAAREISAEKMEQARREIYGDLYHPSLFKRGQKQNFSE